MMKGIFEELAEGHQLPKRLGQELLSSMVERVTRHLQERGTEFALVVWAHWKRNVRRARGPTLLPGRGSHHIVAADKKAAFRPAKQRPKDAV